LRQGKRKATANCDRDRVATMPLVSVAFSIFSGATRRLQHLDGAAPTGDESCFFFPHSSPFSANKSACRCTVASLLLCSLRCYTRTSTVQGEDETYQPTRHHKQPLASRSMASPRGSCNVAVRINSWLILGMLLVARYYRTFTHLGLLPAA
jgi:hypothetical protein